MPAHKTRHIGVVWPGVDLGGWTCLRNAAVLHHHHHVGHGNGLELCVCHVNKGNAKLLLQAPQLPPHLQAQKLIQRGQGLVQQEHPRIGDQRPRQGDALLLAP